VEFGRGQVPMQQILDALGDVGYGGPLVIEREYEPTLSNIREAIEIVQAL
jgi:sugar phosphate isomerase/epimerase